MATKVFVVVASRMDAMARTFARRYGARGVCLLTPADLSHPGWCYRPGDLDTAMAVIGGQHIAVRDITGVVTRLPSVSEYEIDHIAAVDRAYVAAEMQAILLSWLTALRCPVLNRPTPPCLGGPAWCPAQWVKVAARLGMPVTTVHRHAMFSGKPATKRAPRPQGVTVTIVGQRVIGTVDPVLACQARALATAAGVDLLAVRFSGREHGAAFVGAELWPNIAAAVVAHAVLDYFHVRATHGERHDFPSRTATGQLGTRGA